jgi:hypothetical protein
MHWRGIFACRLVPEWKRLMARQKDMNEDLGPCPICGRTMIDGPTVDRHHWVPKSEGGTDVAVVHLICHRMIHRVLSDRELADAYDTVEKLAAHPEIAKFVKWVRKRPPDYVDWPRTRRGRKRR